MVQVIDMIKKISLRKRIVEPGGKLECFMVLTKVGKVCPEPDNRNVVVIAWKSVQPVMIHLSILIRVKILIYYLLTWPLLLIFSCYCNIKN